MPAPKTKAPNWFKMRVIGKEGKLLAEATKTTGLSAAEIVRRLVIHHVPTMLRTKRFVW